MIQGEVQYSTAAYSAEQHNIYNANGVEVLG